MKARLMIAVLVALPAVASAQGHNLTWETVNVDMGRPTSGYLVDDRFSLTPKNYIVGPSMGWNESRLYPDGRTGWAPSPIRVAHRGQGDVGPFSAWCAVESENPQALNWGATPACFLYNGMVEARARGASLAGFEYHGADNGYDGVSAYMGVLDYNRTGTRGSSAWEPVTGLLRLQSTGPEAVDSLASLYGNAKVGVDLSSQRTPGADWITSIALPEEGRIYWRAKPGQSPHSTTDLGGTWTGYHVQDQLDPGGFGIGAWLVTIEHETVFQVWRDWVVVDGGLSATGEVNLGGLPQASEISQAEAAGARALCITTEGRVYAAAGKTC